MDDALAIDGHAGALVIADRLGSVHTCYRRPALVRRSVHDAVRQLFTVIGPRSVAPKCDGQHGLSISAERERAAAALHLGGRQRVLDVACGPGNFTSFFAGQLAGDGFVIGLDNSVPMMERAVRDNSCDRAVYMRGDALDLPFNNRSFDVVSCFAALHLVPEPLGVLHDMVRVLSPGGRIAVMTTYGRESFLVRKGLELGATICGVRVFDRTTVPTFFAAAGLVDIEQQLRGISQFVVARRPKHVTEFGRWRAR